MTVDRTEPGFQEDITRVIKILEGRVGYIEQKITFLNNPDIPLADRLQVIKANNEEAEDQVEEGSFFDMSLKVSKLLMPTEELDAKKIDELCIIVRKDIDYYKDYIQKLKEVLASAQSDSDFNQARQNIDYIYDFLQFSYYSAIHQGAKSSSEQMLINPMIMELLKGYGDKQYANYRTIVDSWGQESHSFRDSLESFMKNQFDSLKNGVKFLDKDFLGKDKDLYKRIKKDLSKRIKKLRRDYEHFKASMASKIETVGENFLASGDMDVAGTQQTVLKGLEQMFKLVFDVRALSADIWTKKLKKLNQMKAAIVAQKEASQRKASASVKQLSTHKKRRGRHRHRENASKKPGHASKQMSTTKKEEMHSPAPESSQNDVHQVDVKSDESSQTTVHDATPTVTSSSVKEVSPVNITDPHTREQSDPLEQQVPVKSDESSQTTAHDAPPTVTSSSVKKVSPVNVTDPHTREQSARLKQVPVESDKSSQTTAHDAPPTVTSSSVKKVSPVNVTDPHTSKQSARLKQVPVESDESSQTTVHDAPPTVTSSSVKEVSPVNVTDPDTSKQSDPSEQKKGEKRWRSTQSSASTKTLQSVPHATLFGKKKPQRNKPGQETETKSDDEQKLISPVRLNPHQRKALEKIFEADSFRFEKFKTFIESLSLWGAKITKMKKNHYCVELPTPQGGTDINFVDADELEMTKSTAIEPHGKGKQHSPKLQRYYRRLALNCLTNANITPGEFPVENNTAETNDDDGMLTYNPAYH